MRLMELVSYLDQTLAVSEVVDACCNGLQVGRDGEVTKIAVAVDANLRTFRQARAEGCQLIIAHHGLIWDAPLRLTGVEYERVRFLIEQELSLYAVHLPLDLHPELGNNIQLLNGLGLQLGGPFGAYRGAHLGFWGTTASVCDREALVARMKALTGERAILHGFGNRTVQRIAVISGACSLSVLKESVAGGHDLVVTGEISHALFSFMEDHRLNVLCGGHYGTEQLGVKAVGRHLADKFGLGWEFIHHPSGL